MQIGLDTGLYSLLTPCSSWKMRTLEQGQCIVPRAAQPARKDEDTIVFLTKNMKQRPLKPIVPVDRLAVDVGSLPLRHL